MADAPLPKCPECRGTGKLTKLWPLYALSMPNEMAWQVKPCWRCKGTGQLLEDDPYVAVKVPKAAFVIFWFLAYAISACVILALLLI